MRTLLVFLLVLGCTTDPSPADIDGGFDSGGGVLCPPENIYLSCFTLEPDGCTPVTLEPIQLGNGCLDTRCPEGSAEGSPRGSCGCEEASDCALDFVGCCGQCDAEPALVSYALEAIARYSNTCAESECAFEEELVVSYEQRIPICESNVCDARVIDRACTMDKECTLVHIPSGDEVCSQLDSINVVSEADFLAYHTESASCETPMGAVAHCGASLECVVDTAE